MSQRNIWNPTKEQAALIAYWIDKRIVSRIDMHGGYPDAFRIFGGCLVIASSDYRDAPELEILTLNEAINDAEGWDCFIGEDGPYDVGLNFAIEVPYEGMHVCSDDLLPN
jgi:hypothetical protein